VTWRGWNLAALLALALVGGALGLALWALTGGGPEDLGAAGVMAVSAVALAVLAVLEDVL